MTALARVVIAFSAAESERRAAESLALGFRREGVEAAVVHNLGEMAAALDEKSASFPELLVAATHLDFVQAVDGGVALARALRQRAGKIAKTPIILLGDADRRDVAHAAGATDFMAIPGQVGDVVTLGRVVARPVEGKPASWQGDLGAFHLLQLVRALHAARRTGVLTLTRAGGARKGELHFFEGELASARAGKQHGLAALQQLLLWPDAHFELHADSVARRQEIPFTPEELFAEAERLLADFEQLTGGIPPNTVFETNPARLGECAGKIPNEIGPLLSLVDGKRAIADIVEDSPFVVAETAKVMARLRELGAVRRVVMPQPQLGGAGASLEDWPIGGDAPGGPSVPPVPEDTGRPRAAKRRVKRRPMVTTPAQGTAIPEIDWSAVLGAPMGGRGFLGAHAPVLPSPARKMEISIPGGVAAFTANAGGVVGVAEGLAKDLAPAVVAPPVAVAAPPALRPSNGHAPEPETVRRPPKSRSVSGEMMASSDAAEVAEPGGMATVSESVVVVEAAAPQAQSGAHAKPRPVAHPESRPIAREPARPPVAARPSPPAQPAKPTAPIATTTTQTTAVGPVPMPVPPTARAPSGPIPAQPAPRSSGPVMVQTTYKRTPTQPGVPVPVPQPLSPPHAPSRHFSAHEEAFFNDDSHLRGAEKVDDFSDLDDKKPEKRERPGLLKRLFGKGPERPPARGVPPARPPGKPPDRGGGGTSKRKPR